MVAAAYLVARHQHKTNRQAKTVSLVSGCIEPSSAGLKLLNEKDGNIYALVSEPSAAIRAGQRVVLRGQKQEDGHPKLTFVVNEVTQDYGACTGGN